MNQIDLARVRADTPSVARRIHLDNAGSSPPPSLVLARMRAHLEAEGELGGYAAARSVRKELDHFYDLTARLIGARANEVAFMDCATRAWREAVLALRWRKGDRILTCRSEYASNTLVLEQLRRRAGVHVDVIPDDADGQIDLAALATMLCNRVRLVSVCHAPTSNGLVNPAAEIGRLLRGRGPLFLLDACQTIGQLPIDVDEIGCDMLAATGRKFLRGPRGSGFLYVREAALSDLEPTALDIRSAVLGRDGEYEMRNDARRFEVWESATATRLGLNAAIEYALDLGLANIAARASALAKRLRANLGGRAGIRVIDRGVHHSAIVSLTIDGVAAEQAQEALEREGVQATAILHDDAPRDPSLTRSGVLRLSPHYFNSESEIDRASGLVCDLARGRQR
jgi:selenocysteine lyase/cysteine desulfurase